MSIIFISRRFLISRAQIVIYPNEFLPNLGLSQQQLLNGIGDGCLREVVRLLVALMSTILIAELHS